MKTIMKVFVTILIIIVVMYSSKVYSSDNMNIEMNITGNTNLQADQTTLTLTISLGEFENIQSGKVLGFEGILNCSEGVFKSITAKGLNGWTIEYKDSTKKIIGDVAEAEPNTTIGTVTFELNDNISATNPKIEFNNVLLTDGTNDFIINKTFNITWESSSEEQEDKNDSSEDEDEQQVQQTEQVDNTDNTQQESTVESEEKVNEEQEISVKENNKKSTTTTGTSISSSSNNVEKNTNSTNNTTKGTTSSSSTSAEKSTSLSSSTAKKLPKAGLKNKLLMLLGCMIILAVVLKIKLKKSKF